VLSEEYMLPGGGVELLDGARWEKKDPCVLLAVGGRFLSGGSRGSCGLFICEVSPKVGPLGLPGLKAGICGGGPGEPPEGDLTPPSICSTSLEGKPMRSGTLPFVYLR
jgi:hypothetical protein